LLICVSGAVRRRQGKKKIPEYTMEKQNSIAMPPIGAPFVSPPTAVSAVRQERMMAMPILPPHSILIRGRRSRTIIAKKQEIGPAKP
jgi:hypothetical protein